MWTRSELKQDAKKVLKKTYWIAFLVSLVLGLAGAYGGSSGSNGSDNSTDHGETYIFDEGYGDLLNNVPFVNDGSININPEGFMAGFFMNPVFAAFLGAGVFALVLFIIFISVAFRLLLGYPLEIGGRRYFIDTAKEEESGLYRLGYAFRKESYKNIIVTMFITDLKIFLWTLLLIIPGVIKGYAYSQVPYLLAENPSLDRNRAMEISSEMTMGHKLNMFVLDLSFLGWYFLGALLFGLGQIFVHPYDNATKAQLYLRLRANAIMSGITNYWELDSSEPIQEQYRVTDNEN